MKIKYINSINEEFEKKEKKFVYNCGFIGTKTRWDAFRQRKTKNKENVDWCGQYTFKLKTGETWRYISEQPDALRGIAFGKILLPKYLDYDFFCIYVYPYLTHCVYLQWYGIADDELE